MRLFKNFGCCAVLCLVVHLTSGNYAFGQVIIPKADSIAMKENIEGFYSMYLGLIKSGKLDADFNPLFVKKKNGKAALDFTNYQAGLKKYGFSDDLIKQKTKAYDDCVSNLAKLPYDTLNWFRNGSELGLISCEFENSYEWIGGNPDPVDRAILSMFEPLNKKMIFGQLEFFYPDSSSAGGANITFRKIGKDWKITEVEL